jgi:adenosine deaminase
VAPTLSRAEVVALPKAQLHLHLEAAMRLATARELAGRYGMQPPRSGPYDGLAGFVHDYETARDLIGSLGDLSRVAAEVVADAVRQGVVWTEVHCVPFNYGGRLGPPEAVIEAVLDGLARAPSGTGGAGLILAHNRATDHAFAERLLTLAARYRDQGVVALGLVGDEASNPPGQYRDIFRAAKESGLLSVPHAGEAAGPASVRGAVHALQADRIGHGVRAVEDQDLVAELADSAVCLDVCPTSNAMLGACPSLAGHQLPALLRSGVRVSLGSDGPLFFGVDVVDEYLNAQDVLGLDAGELLTIAADSLRASAAPPELKQSALALLSGRGLSSRNGRPGAAGPPQR